MHTEDSYSYTGTKVTTSSSTVKVAQGCVTGFKGRERFNSVEAFMTTFDPARFRRYRSRQSSLLVVFGR